MHSTQPIPQRMRESYLWKMCNMQMRHINPGRVSRWFVETCDESVCLMTLVSTNELRPEHSRLYAEHYGAWMHSAGNTISHNELGMAWAWWFMHIRGGDRGLVSLLDSPDISGFMYSNENNIIYGDVGQCTGTAMIYPFMSMAAGDLWVSVLDYETQVIIEPLYDVCKYRGFGRNALGL